MANKRFMHRRAKFDPGIPPITPHHLTDHVNLVGKDKHDGVAGLNKAVRGS